MSAIETHPCPQCNTVGVVETADHRWETCPLCGGDKEVSAFKLVEWELQQGRADTEPEMRAIRPEDFSRLAESSSPPPPEEE